ncbi:MULTISPECIES: hypothetical protein [unclassified Mesorhizobium]|uniref:hypothetical protein n=1 Tax=unclassified Mesorhizobium TaxID=325217 RepID=UPI001FEEE6B0|nr:MULTISPECIES: hypothetical protein [unclassified Mesorhizobium]
MGPIAHSFAQATEQTVQDSSVLSGKWTYRSFHNNPALVTADPKTALSLFFAEAVFSFDVKPDNSLTGAIDWGGGGLDLQGTVQPPTSAAPLTVQIVGHGRVGTQTENWEYDYSGYLAPSWSNGVGQVPALVGSVLRAKPHDGAPAGYVASFVAVKQ